MLRRLLNKCTIPLIIGFSLVFLSPGLRGDEALKDGFYQYIKQFQSPFLEVLSPDTKLSSSRDNYPFWLKPIQEEKWKFSPLGKSSSPITDCDIENLQSCEKNIRSVWSDPISNGIGNMMIRLETRHHPYARHVMLHLPNGVLLKGLLALKGDGKKRPLILFRTGIFSNSHEFFPERFLFMQMFEQSPFNMLLIESLTGAEFIKNNEHLSLGGFDEGITNYYILKQLQSPQEPLAKIISETHLLGVSLGGHGVLYAHLLNDFNKSSLLSSSLALCPLVHLKATFDEHMANPLTRWVINSWGHKRLPELFAKKPELKDDWLGDLLQEINANYKEPLIGLKALHDKKIKLPQEQGDLWSLNNFWPYFKDVKTPLRIVSTEHDPIVPFNLNSQKLQMENHFGIPMTILPRGYHCSLSVAYDWKAMTSLMQNYFLKNSKNFSRQLREKKIAWPEDLDFTVDFDLAPGAKNLLVQIKERTPLALLGLGERRWLEIPLSDLDYHLFSPSIQASADQDLFLRWAYQNISAEKDGQQIILRWQVL